jgi:hypothetical protein
MDKDCSVWCHSGLPQACSSHLVTYFADCRQWRSATYFLDVVLLSFGVTSLKDFGIDFNAKKELLDVDAMT